MKASDYILGYAYEPRESERDLWLQTIKDAISTREWDGLVDLVRKEEGCYGDIDIGCAAGMISESV